MKYYKLLLIVLLLGCVACAANRDWNPKAVVERGPAISFAHPADAPARLLYNRTLADRNRPVGKARVHLSIEQAGDVEIRKYVAACVETIGASSDSESEISKVSYSRTVWGNNDVYFDIDYGSSMYFYLQSVKLVDGNEWKANP